MAEVAMHPAAASNTLKHSTPQPPLDQSDAIASLLSLSLASGGVQPPQLPEVKTEPTSHPSIAAALAAHSLSASVPLASGAANGGKHHRRLSSTGKTRRRLSDAREAANRPSPSLLQSPAALSLATLSLSSSPPSSYTNHLSTSFTGASRTLAPAPPRGFGAISNDGSGIPVSGEDEKNGAIPIPISSSNGRTGKKRGMDHRCESCSKIYRHPSCLIKHRWEHTPHWREASKFVLSKHQQVQLLEAAAILSHMSPTVSGGRSLPEDRSLWPSFLSGGSLPPPEPPIPTNRSTSGMDPVHATVHHTLVPTPSYPSHHPVSSSVPARSTSTGPRLHDYGVGSGVVTQVRPGLIGVTTSSGGVVVIGDRANDTTNGSSTQPVPVPTAGSGGRHYHDAFGSAGSTGSGGYYRSVNGASADSWGSHAYSSAGLHRNGASVNNGTSAPGGWSLPKSSLRSESGYSRSRSHSRTRRTASGSSASPPSDDESVDVDGMMDDVRDRDVNVVIEEEEDEEEGGEMVHKNGISVSKPAGMRTPRMAYDDPSNYGGRYTRLGHQSFQVDAMGRNISLREEDEEMEDMDIGRGKKGPMTEREQEWDGLEMEMDMDMD
ncbi:hypothetical protein FA13DRAFT_1817629 [Coprinellus micaceus]|uniref:C2H2-type domain-containing protein n=1 Tax=Coprinellus micaceus TaxID=71717 RepID=A0A4Y7STV3_COPMI|nr:hypothetical protein FA13DRAFT_1817629 [Coprinellus micaceus]